MNKDEMHLDVYENRSELYTENGKAIFFEGSQSLEATQRSKNIAKTFENGFYAKAMEEASDVLAKNPLSETQSNLIKGLVTGISSEVGRALVGLSCLQLAIKSIDPEQSIRLHKGGRSASRFSWKEGLSMRTLDSNYNTPFLRESELLNINKYGIMMTRSLAENYPYSRLYKAEIRGPLTQWVELVESMECNRLPAYPALCLLLSLLKNRSDAFTAKANTAIDIAYELDMSFNDVLYLLSQFFQYTNYPARAFEVVIHGFMQALNDLHFAEGQLEPLSQMRSANKKHGNIGDIELTYGDMIIESWDAKYGKPYLRDELEELNDKLSMHQNVEIAGFIVNTSVDSSQEILDRADEIGDIHNCEVLLLSFDDWIKRKLNRLYESSDSHDAKCVNNLGMHWLIAVVESFGQKRRRIAPIDEPCDVWLDALIGLMSNAKSKQKTS
jgi:hypothetical protein